MKTTMLERTVLAGCLAVLAAGGCTPSSSGPTPSEPSTGEPPSGEPAAGDPAGAAPSKGEPATGEPAAPVATCLDCPDLQLFCNSATSICICDVNGKRFPRAECPAPGAADPSPPADCRPSDWFCNISGDCRCAR